MDPKEIKELEEHRFKIKSVSNIYNREKIPQPMFKAELISDDIKLNKFEQYPIYKMRSILFRCVRVEKPLRMRAVVQYFVTRSYCKLHCCFW